MALVRRHLVRVIETRAGPRYVVQVPHDQCPDPGWRAKPGAPGVSTAPACLPALAIRHCSCRASQPSRVKDRSSSSLPGARERRRRCTTASSTGESMCRCTLHGQAGSGIGACELARSSRWRPPAFTLTAASRTPLLYSETSARQCRPDGSRCRLRTLRTFSRKRRSHMQASVITWRHRVAGRGC